jgi:hypothetical protein
MTDDLSDFEAYMALPETNALAFKALLDQAMADPEYASTMTVLTVLWREE